MTDKGLSFLGQPVQLHPGKRRKVAGEGNHLPFWIIGLP